MLQMMTALYIIGWIWSIWWGWKVLWRSVKAENEEARYMNRAAMR